MKNYMAIMKVAILVEAEDEVSHDEIEEILHEDLEKNGYSNTSLMDLMIAPKSTIKSNSDGTYNNLV